MHGMNLQVIASPDGTIRWVSGDLPGSTHDTATARIWNILAALRNAGLIALGDKGYHGYDPTSQHVITPYKGRKKPQSQTDANRAHAQLKSWRILHKLRCCPRRVGRLAKAIHVLQNHDLTTG
jgi:DDE superfamily endonuclease